MMFRNKIPMSSKLKYYLVNLKVTNASIHGRSLIWKNNKILVAPNLGLLNCLHIICPEDDNLLDVMEDVQFHFQGPLNLSFSIYQYCLTYTMYFKLAPKWHWIDGVLIEGQIFFEPGPFNGVNLTLTIDDDDLLWEIKTVLVNYCPINLSFEATKNSNLIGSTVYALPHMKHCKVISITSSLPPSCPYTSYSSLRSYWKNMYGMRLPHSEENIFYVQVTYEHGLTHYTYPHVCLLATKPEYMHNVETSQLVAKTLIKDVTERVGNICGMVIDFENGKDEKVTCKDTNFQSHNPLIRHHPENKTSPKKTFSNNVKVEGEFKKGPLITPKFFPRKTHITVSIRSNLNQKEPSASQQGLLSQAPNFNTELSVSEKSTISHQTFPSSTRQKIYTPAFKSRKKTGEMNLEAGLSLKKIPSATRHLKTIPASIQVSKLDNVASDIVSVQKIPKIASVTPHLKTIPASSQVCKLDNVASDVVSVPKIPKFSSATPRLKTIPASSQVCKLDNVASDVVSVPKIPKFPSATPHLKTIPASSQVSKPASDIFSEADPLQASTSVAQVEEAQGAPAKDIVQHSELLTFDDLFQPGPLVLKQVPVVTAKRPAPPQKQKVFADVDTVKKLIEQKSLHKLTLPNLLNYCKTSGLSVKSKMKKEEVLQIIYGNFTKA